MSHAVETIAWKGTTPWHGLGHKVTNDLSVHEFQKAAGVDWDVYLDEMWLKDPVVEGEYVKSEKKVLRRNDTNAELTWVSNNWHPVENWEGFEFFREWCNAGNLSLEVAGSLHGGKIVWILAKTNQSFETVVGDITDQFVLFTIPHMYGWATSVRSTPVRVVCWNTIQEAMSAKSELKVSVSHRQKFDPDAVKLAMHKFAENLKVYKEKTQIIAKARYTPETIVQYASAVFPTAANAIRQEMLSRNAQTLLEALDNQPGKEFAPGTFWQAFNAVTFSVDHLIGRERDTALYSSWYGPNRNVKARALDLALEFSKVS